MPHVRSPAREFQIDRTTERRSLRRARCSAEARPMLQRTVRSLSILIIIITPKTRLWSNGHAPRDC